VYSFGGLSIVERGSLGLDMFGKALDLRKGRKRGANGVWGRELERVDGNSAKRVKLNTREGM
jgi:hypothetical protein